MNNKTMKCVEWSADKKFDVHIYIYLNIIILFKIWFEEQMSFTWNLKNKHIVVSKFKYKI